ncbi:MAG TPA: glycosyltransferase [Bacteroidales bacterium]|jgi:cellulose synthase (UDP-forming)|nr:integral membrane glycosyltransferase [Bacteroidota bacterium]HJN06557.1 glycosyltransferase [Bacteroidales bacterium]
MRTKQDRSDELWKFWEAQEVTKTGRFFFLILVIAGVISIVRFFDWWFHPNHVASLPLFVILSLITWYGLLRLILIWINYLGIKKPKRAHAEDGLKVAIFTTSSPGEPLSMFDKTLEACANIIYPHTTYLLDDTQDPAFKEVAEKHGAVWLELVGLPGAKAGKVNKALQMIDEDFVLIMDPDHIPFPNFLDEVLGYFKDERVGFVQVAQTYYNQYRSFTARGAAEQTYTFYGPTMMGMYGYGTSVAIGANCTFRKKALDSIGGHGIGLAEDLITSIRLHAAGWKSVFNPVVVSRGLVPEDFGSFCKQQLKWSRGVFEILFSELPRLSKTLSLWQLISYFAISTYYLVGVTIFLYVAIPFMYFWGGWLPAKMDFGEFLVNGTPIIVIALLVYLYVQRWLSHPISERGLHWRGMVLKFATWPVFFLGALLAVVNVEIPYIPTAKKAVKGLSPYTRPLIFQVILFILTLGYVIYDRLYVASEGILILTSQKVWGMFAFAFVSIIMIIGGIYAAYESRDLEPEEPWKKIDLKKIKIRRKS